MRGSFVMMLLLTLMPVRAVPLDETSRELLLEFIHQSAASSLVMFTCAQEDGVAVSKWFSAHGVAIQLFEAKPSFNLALKLRTQYSHLVVFLYLSCADSMELLQQASQEALFSPLHYWLLHAVDMETLKEIFSKLPLLPDSHVTTVVNSDVEGAAVELRDVYRTSMEQEVIVTPPRRWQPGQKLSPPALVNDLQGTVLTTAIADLEGDWSQRNNPGTKHLHMWSKLTYAIILILAQRVNFTLQEVFTESWGYLINESFTGMTAMLENGTVDLGTGINLKSYHLSALDPTAEVGFFLPQFIYRRPSLSSVSNIYTLPYSRGVWASYLSTLFILSLILVATERLTGRYLPHPRNEPPTRWSDIFFRALTILCDESFPTTPNSMSSRIVLLFMLILSVFLLTSYGACIVFLMQTSSAGYHSLQELLASPMKIAMEDIPYNVNFWNETTDPIVHKFYKQRIDCVPRSQAFLPLDEGVERVRRGLFAFHVDISAYRVVKDKFLVHEMCGLKTVPMFPGQVITIPVRKKSPYREIFTRNLRWIKETGLWSREWLRWATLKPLCINRQSEFVSVGVQEFYPVLMVFFIGVLTSVAIMSLEILVHRRGRQIIIKIPFFNKRAIYSQPVLFHTEEI